MDYLDYRNAFLAHHGIKGQKWGVRNGPPYPLDDEDHSAREKRYESKKDSDEKAGHLAEKLSDDEYLRLTSEQRAERAEHYGRIASKIGSDLFNECDNKTAKIISDGFDSGESWSEIQARLTPILKEYRQRANTEVKRSLKAAGYTKIKVFEDNPYLMDFYRGDDECNVYGKPGKPVFMFNNSYIKHSSINSEYLMHFGIKGQKWGVRRYQNPDGTWTEAGKERYARKEARKERRRQKHEEKKRKALAYGSPRQVLKYRKELTPAELQAAQKRIENENKIRNAEYSRLTMAKNYWKFFIPAIGVAIAKCPPSVKEAGKSYVLDLINKRVPARVPDLVMRRMFVDSSTLPLF